MIIIHFKSNNKCLLNLSGDKFKLLNNPRMRGTGTFGFAKILREI